MTSSRRSSPTTFTSTGNAETRAPTLSHAGSAMSDSVLVSGSAEAAKKIFSAASAARLRQERASFVYDRQWRQQQQQQQQQHPWPRRGEQPQQQQQQQQQHPLPQRGEQAATDFSRTASMAGYLHKLGSDVPILKRRFFVLRPCTLLYYFVGPNDVEPRGCIDLDDTTVGAMKVLNDGRCRFEINFAAREGPEGYIESTGADGGSRVQMGERNKRQIVLEAQSETIGRQWIEALETERLSHAQSVIEESRRVQADLGFEVDQLKRELEGMKALEQERDAALDDVRLWKSRHESLDAGVRLLSKATLRELGKGSDGSDSSFSSDELLSQARREDEQRLLDLTIPNTGFASLRNAVEQLRSNLGQTAKEACLAAQDASEQSSELKETMAHTETKMQQLLEDNTAIRDENTRRKRDNKILVKEVKNLRAQVEARTMNADEASKLISELEGHVSSALLLRQRIVDVDTRSDDDEKQCVSEEFCNTKSVSGVSSCSDGVAVNPIASKDDVTVGDVLPPGKRQLPLAVKEVSRAEDAKSKSDISTPSRDGGDGGHRKDIAESHALYEDDKGDDMKGKQLNGPPEANAIVTDTGHATSRLSCPLIDVLSVSGKGKAHFSSDSLRQEDMYHLTFYSKKIGLQFQRVPASSEPRGRVASVVAADLGHTRSSGGYGEKNSLLGGDLEKIAAIAQRTRSDDGSARVAMPLDAVLVCGFHGFDESVNKARPDLGARLVAFDGMSVEIGEWTFDRIRRGIQSRGRPITLSFRNDKLSVHQREILTKAVAELKSSIPPRLLDRPSRSSSNRAPPAVEEDMSVETFRSTLTTAPPSPGGNSVSYQSFGEIGGTSRSSDITSSLAPLMSGLITGLVGNKSLRDKVDKVDYADYAHSSPKHLGESLNSHSSHHEFEASLL